MAVPRTRNKGTNCSGARRVIKEARNDLGNRIHRGIPSAQAAFSSTD